jgi:hypothetical protein
MGTSETRNFTGYEVLFSAWCIFTMMLFYLKPLVVQLNHPRQIPKAVKSSPLSYELHCSSSCGLEKAVKLTSTDHLVWFQIYLG